MKQSFNREKHFKEEKNVLLSNRNKITALTNQPKIIGDYCEELIRNLVSEKIDKNRFSVKHGLVFDKKGKTSQECDVIIYEKDKALYEFGDLVVVDANEVKFVIQVKKTLNSKTLKKAIDNLKSVRNLNKFILGWVVGFKTEMLFRTLYRKASRSRSVQFLHAFESDMPRENKSVLEAQMKLFVETIFQCAEWNKYSYTDNLILQKASSLLLTEDEEKNEKILSDIYTNGFP